MQKKKDFHLYFGSINVGIYGYILLTERIYGGALYNIVYCLPMLIWGYIKWKKVKTQENSGVKIISLKNRILLGIVFSIIIIIYALILNKIGSSNCILDSITTVLGFLAIYLMSNKYIEQWFVWAIVNLAGTALWIILTMQSFSNMPMALMWGVYLVNSIYGYITWNNRYNKISKQS